MSIIQEEQKQIEQELIEQSLIEEKLTKRRKAEKSPTTTVDKKKGQKIEFKPARRLPELEAPKGFRIAWKHNTPENVRRLQYEGWETASRMKHNIDVDMGNYYQKLNDSPVNKANSVIVHNEMIAMVLPEEMAIARDEYHRQQTEQQTRAKLRPEGNLTGIMKAAQIKTTMEIN